MLMYDDFKTQRGPALPKDFFIIIDNKLILLDGKEISKDMLDDLQVTSIQSIEIFKGSSALTKYGEKGKSGVIVATTKKN